MTSWTLPRSSSANSGPVGGCGPFAGVRRRSFMGVKAVMLDVPQALLDERRRTGADRWDEMWEGVLHMVPPPSGEHQRVGTNLLLALAPLARSRGLEPFYETGLFRPGVDDDYRVPDQVYARPGQVSRRGVEGGAPLVVEIRSPGDETYEKLPWYASVGVDQVLVVHLEPRAAELFACREGAVVPAEAGPEGLVVDSLGVTVAAVEGRLLVAWEGGSAEI